MPEIPAEDEDFEPPAPLSNSKPNILVAASNLVVKYPNKVALDNVSFDIYEGEIFALLGSNGAGKSTMLSCLCRQKTDYSGSILINGKEAKDNRDNVISTVALVPQEFSFFLDFSVRENLDFAARMYGLPGNQRKQAIEAMLAEYHLANFANVRARNLSGGYKRLLNIAMSVIKDPKLVLLDEPTAGLDVSMRKLINGAIRRFKRKGVSVVLTTHYLEDVEEVADRVMMLSLGKLLSVGTLSELIAKNGGPYAIILSQISGDINRLTAMV
ncbi:MAG TPA: ABC transporter ATP-binding protein, partial [Candidatus Micrarchaeota archaeon]|nr:ABC transporter ATP-binding protein [Candidatus Micrarchaeota archaeon]